MQTGLTMGEGGVGEIMKMADKGGGGGWPLSKKKEILKRGMT